MATIDEIRAAVEAAGQRHYAAASAGDAAAIDELFCDEAVYSHSDGINTPKAEYMQWVANGHYRPLNISHSVEEIRLLADDIAVIRGRQVTTGKVVSAGVEMKATESSSLDVWCQRDGRWQLLAHHMTLILTNGAWAKAFKGSHPDA